MDVNKVVVVLHISIMPSWPTIKARQSILYSIHPIAHSDPQADIISSFLSTVPAGFPLSPGAALAELTGLAPLSPGLGHNPSYHFSMSPRHQVFIVTLRLGPPQLLSCPPRTHPLPHAMASPQEQLRITCTCHLDAPQLPITHIKCLPLLSCHESPFLWTSWISSKEIRNSILLKSSTTMKQPALSPSKARM